MSDFDDGQGALVAAKTEAIKKKRRAAELFHKATVADPDNTLAPYNCACALAKLKHVGTEAALKAAIAAGGAKVKAKAAKDADFAEVRGEAWFAALLQ